MLPDFKHLTWKQIYKRIGCNGCYRIFGKQYPKDTETIPNWMVKHLKVPTFNQFIETILYKYPDNVHWIPYSSLCHPCSVHYNYIVKLETFSDDIKLIKNRNFSSNHTQSRTSIEEVKFFFSKLSKTIIDKLKEHYHYDLNMFDYSGDINQL